MRLYVIGLVLSISNGLPAFAETSGVEGIWKYSEPDGGFEVRLKRNGACQVTGVSAAASRSYSAWCTYERDGPSLEIRWKDRDGVAPPPLHLVVVASGALMRVEGEPKRPLHRVWDEPPPLPAPINLADPGVMATLEEHDPAGYRKVVELVDLVHKAGCRGAAMGEIKALVRWEFIRCGSGDNPPTATVIGFWLGGARYRLDIPPG